MTDLRIPVYTASLEEAFTKEMEAFRREQSNAFRDRDTSLDVFDEKAFHISMRRDGVLVGLVRANWGAPFLKSWARALDFWVPPAQMIEISRLVCHRSARLRLASPHLIVCEALLYAASLQAKWIVAAKDSTDRMLPFLFSLGATTLGSPFEGKVPPRAEVVSNQSIQLCLDNSLKRILCAYHYCISVSNRYGVRYESTISHPHVERPSEQEIARWKCERSVEQRNFRYS
ncbi:hypothetical protein [Prosthecobacter sp.]|uniref:hypothetical protein n=1 Tax=Prosthecobacter sp. TaxID=1965333 RepID=UPI003784839E